MCVVVCLRWGRRVFVSHLMCLITPWKERAHKLLGLTRERGLLWRGASRRGGGLMREGCIREGFLK